jgi:protein disulfide-isomerase
MKFIFSQLVTAFVVLCSPTISARAAQNPTESPALQGEWFSGSVENAFLEAQKQQKPVLLFWSAVWCPFCNEIKSTVFSRPEFKSFLNQSIAVYIDGDNENAQIYGEKFRIGGFPTILFLTPDGKEITRFSENLTLDEFQKTFESVLASPSSVEEAIAQVKLEKATQNEWKKLALFQWNDSETQLGSQFEKVAEELRFLTEKCPSTMIAEKAALAAAFLNFISSLEKPDFEKSRILRETEEWARSNWQKLLSQTDVSPAALFAARSLHLNAADTLLPWIHGFAPKKDFSAAVTRVVQNLVALRQNKDLPVYAKLETHATNIAIAKQVWKKKPEQKTISSALKQTVEKAVHAALEEAKSPLVRQPTVLGAAHLWVELNQTLQAMSLLKNEIPKSNTPYYYESTLASIADKSGDFSAALEWSAKAANSATGRMTKARWLARDIGLRLKHQNKVDAKTFEPHFTNRVKEYFDFSFAQPDAFTAGNLKRSRALMPKLDTWAEKPGNQKLVSDWLTRCDTPNQKYRESCVELFMRLKK